MLRLFIEWDGGAATPQLFLNCSSCGGIIDATDIAVALYPLKIQSMREIFDAPVTELDWATVYTAHSGECAYRAKTLALETYRQIGAMQLSVFLSLLGRNVEGLREMRPRLWEQIKQEMEWDEEGV